MQITLNGDAFDCSQPCTVAAMLEKMQLGTKLVAVERNGEIVPMSQHTTTELAAGDKVEVVRAIGGGQPEQQFTQTLKVGSYEWQSRLLVGTGKYKDMAETKAATEASGSQVVTVAIRRTNIGQNADEPNLLEVISPEKYTILPNTAGCYTVEDSLRTCRLARELLGDHKLVKLEVLGDAKTLYPDITATLEAAAQLVKEGFEVMAYTSDDPLIAKRLEELGCVAVMPLAGPIGSGLGIQNKYNIREIIENANVPIIIDAGVGTASDAAEAMELGCDGVLMNTAIAAANKPVMMAKAMKLALESGRMAYEAGRMPRRRYANASSPLDGTFF